MHTNTLRKWMLLVAAFIISGTTINCLFPQSAFTAQDVIKTETEIIEAVHQNAQALTNLEATVIIVRSKSADYIESDQTPKKAVHGRITSISSSKLLYMKPAYFTDELSQELLLGDKVLIDRRRNWRSASQQTASALDYGQYVDNSGKIIGNADVVAYKQEIAPPLWAFSQLQLQIDDNEDPDISLQGTKLSGRQNYRGLECLKLSWGEEGKTENWGYRLVCPDRGYRVIYAFTFLRVGNASYRQTTSVEEIRQVNGIWIPWQTRYESVKTRDNGSTSNQIMKSRVIECKVDSIDVDRLFEPLLSPGTSLFDETGNPEVVGGDTSTIIAQIQKGDFSILKEEDKNLTPS